MTIRFRIPTFLVQLSNWIDDKFFPLPAAEKIAAYKAGQFTAQDWKEYHERQKTIDLSANEISKAIAGCKSLEQCEGCRKMIVSFKKLYGFGSQVTAAVDSLHLSLYHKERDLFDLL